MFQFKNLTVSPNDFYKERVLRDVFTLDMNNIVVSDLIPCKKDCKYIIAYKDDRGVVGPLLIKTPKNVYSSGVSRYSENSPFQMGFNLKEHEQWMRKYHDIWFQVEEQIFNSLSKNPIGDTCWLNAKLKQFNGQIRTVFHNKPIPEQGCECEAIIKIDSVYKNGNNLWPQTYVEEVKHKMTIKNHLLSPSGSARAEDDEEDFI